MENTPILKVYTNNNGRHLTDFFRCQIVHTIEESNVVFVGGGGDISHFLFPFEPVLNNLNSNRNTDLQDVKTIMRCLSLNKPIIGFNRGLILLAALSGNYSEIYYSHNARGSRTVRIGDKTLDVYYPRHFCVNPRRSSDFLLGNSFNGRADFYQRSKDHDRINSNDFKMGDSEVVLFTRLNALGFAFEITSNEKMNFVSPVINDFMTKNKSDLISSYPCIDMRDPKATTNPVDASHYMSNTSNRFAEFLISHMNGLSIPPDLT